MQQLHDMVKTKTEVAVLRNGTVSMGMGLVWDHVCSGCGFDLTAVLKQAMTLVFAMQSRDI